nr:hypothetical protein [Paraburkholderia sp. BL8N3]
MTVAAAAGKRRRLRNRGTGNGLAAANRHAAFKVDAFPRVRHRSRIMHRHGEKVHQSARSTKVIHASGSGFWPRQSITLRGYTDAIDQRHLVIQLNENAH